MKLTNVMSVQLLFYEKPHVCSVSGAGSQEDQWNESVLEGTVTFFSLTPAFHLRGKTEPKAKKNVL